MDGTLAVAIIAFVGVLLSPVIAGFITTEQQRRLERHKYIDKNVERLRELRGSLQFYQIAYQDLASILYDKNLTPEQRNEKRAEHMHTKEYLEMEVAFGNAYALMLSVDVKDVRKLAPIVLSEESDLHAKLGAIDKALGILGEEYDFIKRGGFGG